MQSLRPYICRQCQTRARQQLLRASQRRLSHAQAPQAVASDNEQQFNSHNDTVSSQSSEFIVQSLAHTPGYKFSSQRLNELGGPEKAEKHYPRWPAMTGYRSVTPARFQERIDLRKGPALKPNESDYGLKVSLYGNFS